MLNRRFSKRAEVGISVAILVYASLVIVGILTFGQEGNRWQWIVLLAWFLPTVFLGDLDLIRSLDMKRKLILALVGLVSAGFIIAAVVTFVHDRDWPAKYLYAAAMIWLFVVVALKRRARRSRVQ